MPSDTWIYRDDKKLRTSRRAYEGIYKARGWRLKPPNTPQADTAGGEPGDQPTDSNPKE